MKNLIFLIGYLFSSLIFASEIIYFSDSNGLSYLNQINLVDRNDSDIQINLGGSIANVQKQEIIQISEQIIYLKELLHTGQTRLKVIDIKATEILAEFTLSHETIYDNYVVDRLKHKLYFFSLANYVDLSITQIDTQRHAIEDNFIISVPGISFYSSGLNDQTKFAYHQQSNSLFLSISPGVVQINLASQNAAYIEVSINDQELLISDGSITSIHLPEQSDLLFFLLSDGQIKQYDISQNKLTQTFQFACELCYAHREKLYATDEYFYRISNRNVEVYNYTTQEFYEIAIDMPKYFTNDEEEVHSLYLSPDKNKLYILFNIIGDKGDHSNLVSIDMLSRRLLSKIEIQEQVSQLLGFSSNGQFAYFSANLNPNFVHLIDLESYAWIKTMNIGLAEGMLMDDAFVLYEPQQIIISSQNSFIENSINTIGANLKQSVGRMAALPNQSMLYFTQAYKTVPVFYGDQAIPRYSPESTVSVLNLHTKEMIKQIEVGKFPLGILIDQQGEYGYVANCGDNSISVLNLQTNKNIDTIPVGMAPIGLAANPNSAEIYVTIQGEHQVSVISPVSRAIEHTIELSSAPGNILVHPDGNTAYIATQTGHSILVVDLIDKKEIKSIPISEHLYSTIDTYGCFSEEISGSETSNYTISLSNRGLHLNEDGSKLTTAIEESQSLVIINTQNNQVEQSMSYQDILNSSMADSSIAPQITTKPFFISRDSDSEQTETALNLYDQQNILVTHFNYMPTFDRQEKNLVFPEILVEQRKHMASLEYLANQNTDLFRLSSSKRIIELPLLADKEPVYFNDSRQAYIPELLLINNGEVEHCQVILKQLENELFLYKVQDARLVTIDAEITTPCANDFCQLDDDLPFCNGLQSEQENIAIGHCDSSDSCSSSDSDESQKIIWTDFWDAGSLTFAVSPYDHPVGNILIKAIENDGQGGLWISSGFSVAHLKNNNRWEVLEKQIDSFSARSLSVDPNNELWGSFAESSGYFSIEEDIFNYNSDGQFTRFNSGLTGFNKTLSAYKIYVDSQGTIWVIGRGIFYSEPNQAGIYVRDNTIAKKDSSGEWQYYSSELLAPFINNMHEDGQGGLWISQNNNLIHFSNNGTFTKQTKQPYDPYQNFYHVLYLDEQNTLWTVDNMGLAALDGQGNWQNFTPEAGKLPSANITGIQPDQNGGIWIATDKGLAHFRNGQWSVFNTANSSLIENNIRFIESDGAKGLWIISFNNTLSHVKLRD